MLSWLLSKKEKVGKNRINETESSNTRIKESDIGSTNSIETEVIDIFNGTPPLSWRDPETGLIWEVKNKNNYDDKFTYSEAIEYARNLNIKHYDSSARWRVPTMDELMTLGSAQLFDYRNKSTRYKTRASWKEMIEGKRNGKLFVKKPLSGFMNHQIESWYWSSTEVEDYRRNLGEDVVKRMTKAAWAINFFEGGNYHNNVDEKNSVICVRKPIAEEEKK